MTHFLPLFPLDIVVFPGEQLNLHIFEDKYKQLINDCLAQKKMFGIPSVVDNMRNDLGTAIEIVEVAHTYNDGRMDIKTIGKQVFRILEPISSIPDKLYSGGIVYTLQPYELAADVMMNQILPLVKKLHQLLFVTKQFAKPEAELTSFDIAHHVGFSLKEEYDLLSLTNEKQRLQFIANHINKVIPVIENTENLKARIRLNGHFKELKGFNL